MNQIALIDIEYSNRKKKTKREEFLEVMEKNNSLAVLGRYIK